ncbi:SLAM family member 5-like [Eleutherodactylus coqui]|uniref:SLAM family member 5-like n=1 Tax=Eleutherodactylus coqui TaxID=57060 RepID=UPI0034618C4D
MPGRVIGTLTILLAAKLVISEGQPAVPLPVPGIIGQSVNLTLPVDQTGPEEEEIYWTFQNIILAHFTYNHLKIRNEKFKNRLETLNNSRSLRITNLRKEDGGIYSATIHSADKMKYNTSYNLTVYEPVPSPTIQTECRKPSIDGGNVTLHCSVPSNTSDISYTWKCRQNNTEYQLCNTGSIIQMSLPPDHQDMEFLCIVQNPADQKNKSINTHNICPNLLISNKGR